MGNRAFYLSYINTDVKKYFPGVGSTFVVITVEDSPQDKCLVETDKGSLEISLLDIRILPRDITRKNIEHVNSILTGGREWKVKCDYHSSYRKKWEDLEGNIEILHTSTKSFFFSFFYCFVNITVHMDVNMAFFT